MNTTDVAELDEADQACLDELGQYLVSTDTWQRFAIWLLHKHFEPAAGEVFVERAVVALRGTETTLVKRRCAQGLNMASMRFDPDVRSGVGVIGMEFADPADFGVTPSVNSGDETVVAGIAARLRANGRSERFGVRLIRTPLGLMENEVLVETCDVAHRTLRCTVAERDGVHPTDTVATCWQWKPSLSKTRPRPTRDCFIKCYWDSSNGTHWFTAHL
jgi:hypothetical protein